MFPWYLVHEHARRDRISHRHHTLIQPNTGKYVFDSVIVDLSIHNRGGRLTKEYAALALEDKYHVKNIFILIVF